MNGEELEALRMLVVFGATIFVAGRLIWSRVFGRTIDLTDHLVIDRFSKHMAPDESTLWYVFGTQHPKLVLRVLRLWLDNGFWCKRVLLGLTNRRLLIMNCLRHARKSAFLL